MNRQLKPCKRIKAVSKAAASMSVESMVQGMIDTLNEALGDAAKHDRGNSAAGTRVRKAMQSCKNCAQDVRKQVQSDKNSR
jgi:formamidopyrimidine-DNA glycosylase